MKVELLNYTPNPEELVAKSAKLCYSSVGISEIKDKLTSEEIERFVKHLVDIGHESVLEHINFTFAAEGISRACYDKDTQVLTRDGWKYFKDVDIDKDLFATINKNKEVEFHKAINKTEYKHSGDMHLYKSQNANLLVTPNHKMYIKKYDVRTKQGFHLIPSENIKINRFKLNRDFNYNSEATDKVTILGYEYKRKNNQGKFYNAKTEDLVINKSDFIKLLAWYIAEGGVWHNSKENSYSISIAQSDPKYREEIMKVISNCGFKPTPSSRKIQFKNLTLGRFLKSLGLSNEKNIPYNIFDFFNKELATIFLNEYEKSDSSNDNGHIKYYTTSKKLSEQLEILCYMAGYTCKVWIDDRVGEGRYSEKSKNIITHNYPCYVISLSKGKRNKSPIIKKDMHFKSIKYNDFVYCVEVPNHTLFVKRDGVAVWCGNCTHQLVRHRMASFSQQSQRYVSMDSPDFIIPDTIKNNKEAYKEFSMACNSIRDTYNTMVELGVPKEDARSILPNATGTKIVFTMNARSLLNFFSLRCCSRAQSEIRMLANKMLNLVKSIAPNVFGQAGATCNKGYCKEGDKTCGKLDKLKEMN